MYPCHHVLLSRIWPHEGKVQLAGLKLPWAAAGGPNLWKPPHVGSVAVANKALWEHQVPPVWFVEVEAGLVRQGAGCGVCLAWEKALAVRYACVGRGSAGRGLCQVMVGIGFSVECCRMVPGVSFDKDERMLRLCSPLLLLCFQVWLLF